MIESFRFDYEYDFEIRHFWRQLLASNRSHRLFQDEFWRVLRKMSSSNRRWLRLYHVSRRWREQLAPKMTNLVVVLVVRFPAGRPWSCIFRNWSRFGSYNVYLYDTRISYTLLWISKKIMIRLYKITPSFSWTHAIRALIGWTPCIINDVSDHYLTQDQIKPTYI